MARQFALAQQIDGINLMRAKGGASPSSLFDLKNGWVTSKRTIKARPGSVNNVSFPAGSVGVVGFEGKFHTFSHAPAVSPVDPLVVFNVLLHPTGSLSATLLRVHRAFPILGRLYVVAEFSDGVVQHYWLENPAAWQADTAYSYGSVVQPVIQNGYYYEIIDTATPMAWQANTETAINDVRQPRVVNGFRYVATATTGAAPARTGNIEPTWPTTDGATVIERRYVTEEQVAPGDDSPSDSESIGNGGGGGGNEEYAPFPEVVR